MKKLVICVAVLAMVWTSSAIAESVPLLNAGFEDPILAVGDKIKGFDGTRPGYPYDVPGWEDDCLMGTATSSGIKNGAGQRSISGQGAHLSYDKGVSGETIVWQLTDKTIAADEIYNLSIWAWADGPDARLKVSLFYDVSGVHTEVAAESQLSPMSHDDTAYACGVEFTANDVSASIDQKIGIKFETLGGSFVHLDDATLNVIPEPATMILLGLGSLALLKRRRA